MVVDRNTVAPLCLCWAGEQMIFGILIPVLFVALIVFGIRKIRSGDEQGEIQGHSIRRFFQYLLLYGLLIIAATGLSGLLNRLLARETLVTADQSDLARNFSFVVVGVPLYVLIAIWARRNFREDPAEQKSFAWSFYLTASSITSLTALMFALYETLSWVVGIADYRSESVARLIVWGGISGGHWWVGSRITPKTNSRGHYLIGSLIGLGTAVAGMSSLLAGTIARVLNLGADALFLPSADPIAKGVVILLVGVPVWILYWIKNFAKASRDPLWLAYVLLAGVGGGLVMAISAASMALYSTLVWFIGDPNSSYAAVHFRSVSDTIASASVGVLVWWYHHAVLEEDRRTKVRTEVQRVYEYLMAGIALVAAAGGLTMILVAIVESLIRASIIIGGGGGGINALLAAATLLVVGGPVWWVYWNRIEIATEKSPKEEHLSSTRRFYLFVLFGIGGIAAVITLLVGAFLLFDDIFKGNFGGETIRRIRYALGVLITTGAISGYHWAIYRTEREHIVAGFRGPRFVLLIGAKDPDLAREISRRTGGRVQSWQRTDNAGGIWSQEKVTAALDATEEESVLLIAGPSGIEVIPVDRT